ncbi:MAG: hypothetical protein KBD52_01140 [Candidatus Pacebacteria bacterium]|nr:hypothetical protein [Candidatus Paceibacterota bacterium]
MKKYLVGSLVLGVMVFGGMLPSKVNAGLSLAQQNSIITMLQNAGATTQAIAQVQAAFGMMPTSSTGTTSTTSTTTNTGGTTTTTTVSTGGTISPCTNNAMYSFATGLLCPNYVAPTTPQTGGPLYPPTTTTTTPTTGGPLFPPTTPSTPSTPSNCISTQTNVAPYVYINGAQVQCVKVCTGQVAWNPYLGLNGGMCPTGATNVVSTTNTTPSITVVAPNGAEEYAPGASVGLKWSSTNIASTNDQVYLLLNYYTPEGTFVASTKLLDTLTVNDGGEAVTLPTTLPAGASWGNNFKVTVGIASVATDDSDKNFIIE